MGDKLQTMLKLQFLIQKTFTTYFQPAQLRRFNLKPAQRGFPVTEDTSALCLFCSFTFEQPASLLVN